jgi:TRAP-type uncharacterized transport system fused permease subunit
VAGNALRLGVGLFVVPLAFIANPALLELAQDPVLALAAAVKIGLGLLAISYAIVGWQRRGVAEAGRPVALAIGLGVVFGYGF